MKTDDRFTIIVFSDYAEVQIVNAAVDDVDLQTIKYHDGGTSFSSAFTYVSKVINQFKNKSSSSNLVHQNFAIVFMTDGEDQNSFEEEINTLVDTHHSVIKKFWTFALTDRCESIERLQEINRKMNGSFYDIQSPAGLVPVYAEIATSTTVSIS